MADGERYLRAVDPVRHAAAIPVQAPRLEVVHRGACAQIAVTGELDFSSVGAVQGLLDGTALDHGSIVDVDLRGCTFIDSSVVALLLRLHRRTTAQRAELVVRIAGGAVRRTLEVAGVCDLLTVLQDGPGGSRVRARGDGPRLVPPPDASE